MEGYIKMLTATKGMFYWQKALLNYKFPILKLKLLNDDIFIEQLPILFLMLILMKFLSYMIVFLSNKKQMHY